MVCVFILGTAFGAEMVSSYKDEKTRRHTVDMPINRNSRKLREERIPRTMKTLKDVVSCGNCPYVCFYFKESYSSEQEAREEMKLHKLFCTHQHDPKL